MHCKQYIFGTLYEFLRFKSQKGKVKSTFISEVKISMTMHSMENGKSYNPNWQVSQDKFSPPDLKQKDLIEIRKTV